MELRIGTLSKADLTDAWRLSTAAGWNQTTADWRRLLDLFPETCFGGWIGDDLVATSTLASYENRIGWIGMVLVARTRRQQGYGSALFEAALDAGREAGLEVIGLDATDAGRRVYDGYGFESVAKIDRWQGTLDLPEPNGTVEFDSADRIATFDARRCGVTRVPLLDHLLESDGVMGIRSVRDGETAGYAIVRPGRTCPQVGPIVADDRDALENVLGGVSTTVSGPLVVDALRQDAGTSVLESAGLSVSRRLHRMTRRGTLPALDGDGVVAATGFEWG